MTSPRALSFMVVELVLILINVLFNRYWIERDLPTLIVEICLYVLVGLSAPLILSNVFTRNIRELAELAGVISRSTRPSTKMPPGRSARAKEASSFSWSSSSM